MKTFNVMKCELHGGLFSKRKSNLNYLLKTRPDIILVENGLDHEVFLRKWAKKNHWKFSDAHISSADKNVFIYRNQELVNTFVNDVWKQKRPYFINPIHLEGKDAGVLCRWRA